MPANSCSESTSSHVITLFQHLHEGLVGNPDISSRHLHRIFATVDHRAGTPASAFIILGREVKPGAVKYRPGPQKTRLAFNYNGECRRMKGCWTIFATTKESSFSAHPSFDPSLPAPFKNDSELRLLGYGSITPADYFTHGGQFSHHV